nr:hypothetical protein [Cytophagales bacterium]
MNDYTICIVGGGACGVAALAELMVQLKMTGVHDKTKVVLIEKGDKVGQGLAFGTDQPGHLLNTQANLMGIHSFEPDHFAGWLETQPDDHKNEVKGDNQLHESYTTRRLYGNYLKEQVRHYLAEAEKIGLEVHIIHDEATDLSPDGEGWEVTLAHGPVLYADHVLLVPGTPKPNNFPEFDGLANYFDFPWPSEPIIDGIPKNAEVAILGSSLSAIDAIMTLTDSGHQGKISLYSLDGLMPRVQPVEGRSYKRKYLTLSRIHQIRRSEWRQPRIKDLFRLFQQEVENYTGAPVDWKATERKGFPAQELLEQDIRIAEDGGDAFINILYDMRYEESQVWDWLSIEEKQRFKKWLGPYWTVTRYGMPLINARRLADLFQKGKLEVNFPMRDVTFDETKQRFLLQFADVWCDEREFLINATGPSKNVEKMQSVLIQNLLKKGIIEAYPVGGIVVDPSKMEVISSKERVKNLYAVGHICNGLLLDVNAVWFNVQCIATLSEHIVKKLQHGDHS